MQRDALETSALKAIVGKMENLADGFMIQTVKGPVAAIYWDGTRKGIDLEISVAKGRLTSLCFSCEGRTWPGRTASSTASSRIELLKNPYRIEGYYG
jgi:hypothetical protein